VDVQVITADEDSADTRGRVFLGLGGREFRLAEGGDEFDRGVTTTFKLGEESNVAISAQNDPRAPQLTLADLARYPLYVRLEEAGPEPQWLLERVTVTVNPGTATATEFDNLHLVGLEAGHKIWLGAEQGRVLHLGCTRSAADGCTRSAADGWPFTGDSGTGTVIPHPATDGQTTHEGSGLPHTVPDLKETPVLNTPLDQPYVIAVETGLESNYLRPDDPGHDKTPQHVQIWNKDVVRFENKAEGETMQWHLIRHENDGSYSLLSNPRHNALTLEPDHRVLLQPRTDATNQRWLLTPVPSAAGNTYTIRSAQKPEYALIRINDGHDTIVEARRTWGGDDPLFAWHIRTAPADLTAMYPLPRTPA
jgi:hypothetical protein